MHLVRRHLRVAENLKSARSAPHRKILCRAGKKRTWFCHTELLRVKGLKNNIRSLFKIRCSSCHIDRITVNLSVKMDFKSAAQRLLGTRPQMRHAQEHSIRRKDAFRKRKFCRNSISGNNEIRPAPPVIRHVNMQCRINDITEMEHATGVQKPAPRHIEPVCRLAPSPKHKLVSRGSGTVTGEHSCVGGPGTFSLRNKIIMVSAYNFSASQRNAGLCTMTRFKPDKPH